MAISLLFLIWILMIFASAALLPHFIPYLGFFPYGQILTQFQLPYFVSSLANFDGVHYILIARNGYVQYEQAFFPFYPLLIRLISPLLGKNHLLTGLLISILFFFAALMILSRYFRLIGLKSPSLKYSIFNEKLKVQIPNYIFWTIIFLLIFPGSFFFSAVYTEGLFLFLMITTLYFLEKKQYQLAIVFGFLSSLTRITGLLLTIPIALKLINEVKKKHIINCRLLITFFSPLLGLSTYCLYLWRTTGDPLYFFHSLPAFGAQRSTTFIVLPQVYYRYLKIILTATPNFQYFISCLEVIIFSLVFFVLLKDLFSLLKKNYSPLLGLNLFSLANILLPTFTGSFSSIPRYSLMSLSFFIALARLKNSAVKIALALIFGIVNLILLGFFIQGYFVS